VILYRRYRLRRTVGLREGGDTALLPMQGSDAMSGWGLSVYRALFGLRQWISMTPRHSSRHIETYHAEVTAILLSWLAVFSTKSWSSQASRLHPGFKTTLGFPAAGAVNALGIYNAISPLPDHSVLYQLTFRYQVIALMLCPCVLLELRLSQLPTYGSRTTCLPTPSIASLACPGLTLARDMAAEYPDRWRRENDKPRDVWE